MVADLYPVRSSTLFMLVTCGALVAACGAPNASGTGGAAASGTGGAGTGGGATGGGGAAPVTCGTKSGAALAQCVERPRYDADLTAIAEARPPGSAGWKKVQDLCAERFEMLGYHVERHEYGTGVNVIGTLAGGDLADESVLVSAHYDSVPDCPGADDNGTGVAGVLEAARVLAQGKYRRTLVVACWDEEEDGLVGSDAYAARAKSDGDSIAAAFVFEMIGYRSSEPDSQTMPPGFNLIFPQQSAELAANEFRGDFIALVGDSAIEAPQQAMVAAAPSLGLPVVSLVLDPDQKKSNLFADLRRSDHASFWDRDYPAMMLTDTANFRNPHYHCSAGPDAVADLDTAFSAKVVQITVSAAADTLAIQ